MSFDRDALIAACDSHGTVTRVVVASVKGSAPREVGASMIVWRDGFSGTIGGGTLEHDAMRHARHALDHPVPRLSKHALGPDLGQCCGGAVELWTEVFDAQTARALPLDVIIRGRGDMPLAVKRISARARDQGQHPKPGLISGWMVEPVHKPTRQIWIWGAGHVGRALVSVLAPLPDMALTWVDTDKQRFPDHPPEGVTLLPAENLVHLVRYAPPDAEHLIVTYSHELDLELCHQLLSHGFGFAGLIGSRTKWARFRSRLAALGHPESSIRRITCPIGDPAYGKHPQAIAVTVGFSLLAHETCEITKEKEVG